MGREKPFRPLRDCRKVKFIADMSQARNTGGSDRPAHALTDAIIVTSPSSVKAAQRHENDVTLHPRAVVVMVMAMVTVESNTGVEDLTCKRRQPC